jgi:hypothetical protein
MPIDWERRLSLSMSRTAIEGCWHFNPLGTVKDPSGKIVAPVVIRLTNKGSNAARSTLSNEVGLYGFSNVDVGSYELSVEAPGFQRLEFTVFDLGARDKTPGCSQSGDADTDGQRGVFGRANGTD